VHEMCLQKWYQFTPVFAALGVFDRSSLVAENRHMNGSNLNLHSFRMLEQVGKLLPG